MRGKDFVQIKSGPFDIALVFAPDGIESYEAAKTRMDISSGLPVLNIRDIIASKRAARVAPEMSSSCLCLKPFARNTKSAAKAEAASRGLML